MSNDDKVYQVAVEVKNYDDEEMYRAYPHLSCHAYFDTKPTFREAVEAARSLIEAHDMDVDVWKDTFTEMQQLIENNYNRPWHDSMFEEFRCAEITLVSREKAEMNRDLMEKFNQQLDKERRDAQTRRA